MTEHDWRPIPRWPGRYRCTCHGIIGHRKETTDRKLYKEIIPYLCQVSGCTKGAVLMRRRHHGRGSRQQLCAEHRGLADA